VLIDRNSDGSYSASQRLQGRLVIAEGNTRTEAIRRCVGLVSGLRDLAEIQAKWAAATNQPRSSK